MKKVFLLLVFIFVFLTFAACSADEQSEPAEGMERVILLNELYINGKPNKFYEYDEKGNIITRSWYMGGVMQEEYKYLYDEHNRVTDVFRRGDHTVKLYDENGNLVSETTTDEKGSVKSEEIYNYDRNSNLTKRHYSDDDKEYKYTFKYNKQNKLIKETYKTTDEKEDSYTIVYEYGDDGVLLTEEKSYSNGNTKIKFYNSDGSVKKWEDRFADSGEIGRGLFAYNEEGKVTEEVYYKGGSEEYQIERFYDEDGKLDKEIQRRDLNENLDSVTTAKFIRNKKGDIIFIVEREHQYNGLRLTFNIYGENVEKAYILDCGDIFDIHFHRFKYKTHTIDVSPERAEELKEIQKAIMA